MWHGAGGWAVPDVSEDYIAFIFKREADQEADNEQWSTTTP